MPEAALIAGKHTSLVSAGRAWVVLQFLVAMLMTAPGCNLGGGAPPPEGQLHIENVAKWYQLYRADNRKAPPDEAAFIAFIKTKLQARGDAVNPDELLTSPRDGQKYVVQYGEPNSGNIERNVAVYEKEGYGGKKLVAFEAAWSKEVDDAELQSLLSRE